MAKTGAALARGQSKQDYRTPPEFLREVIRRFGKITLDAAADPENRVCPQYFGVGSVLGADALALDWERFSEPGDVVWCNPPFGTMAPWAEACRTQQNRPWWTLLLAPASVGANWFGNFVDGQAMIFWISPRITFVGEKNGYPRDLMLAAYGYSARGTGRMIGDW